MDKGIWSLVSKDSPERPGNGDRAREVSLRSGEWIGCSRAFQKEQGQEHKDLSPDAGRVGERIDTKRLECGEEDKYGRPAMVEGERQVNEDLVTPRISDMILLHMIVYVRDGWTDEQSENKGNDVMMGGPKIYVDGVEDAEEREPPGDTIDNDTFASGEELIDDRSKK